MPQGSPSAYDYAYEQAFLVLPAACVRAHGLSANAAERPTLKDLWVGRISELPRTVPLGSLSCGCGWAIFMSGSGGFSYDNWFAHIT